MSQNAVEALFAERWGDVVDLVEAFRAFEARALDQFESKAGPMAIRPCNWLSVACCPKGLPRLNATRRICGFT
jgi:hypothetical protein